MNVRRLLWSMLCAGAMCTGAMAGGQISPVFTYQGVLKSSGAPYNGTADLRFTLFDAPSGGSVMGAPIPVNAVQVTGEETTERVIAQHADDQRR